MRREETDRTVEAEVALHIELRVEQLVAQGWAPDAARAEAERRFGARGGPLYRAARRRDRVARLAGWRDGLIQDARHALRGVVREPAFAAVVIVTMALGIGANAAMFGVADRLLVRGPDHVVAPHELVHVVATRLHPEFGEERADRFGWVTYAGLRDAGMRGLAGVAAYRVSDAVLGAGPEASPVRLGAATWDYFPLLGVRPALGRFPSAEEDAPPAGADVAVLSYEAWQGRFGGSADVLGREIRLRGEPYTVIGVTPRGFTGTELGRVDVWVPMSRESRGIRPDWPTAWNAQWLRVVARRAPGVAVGTAAEEATRAWQALREGLPSGPASAPALELAPLTAVAAGREPLEASVARWLVGVAAVVLLIACANVTNLLLARGARRRRELAVRVALGIGRGRLTRMLTAETLLLVALGGAAALAVAAWAGALIRTVLLPDVLWSTPPVDRRVLLFTFIVTLATGLVTGVLPALRFARRTDPASVLRAAGRAGGGDGRSRLRGALTVAQSALSVVLLVGAGLFVRSLDNALDAELGVDADAVLSVDMLWPPLPPLRGAVTNGAQVVGGDPRDVIRSARNAFHDRALEAVRALPGVQAAAISVGTPFHHTFGVTLRGPDRDIVPEIAGGPFIAAVSADYFATTGTRLLQGRVFETSEGAGTEPVTIVNETMARGLWPGGDALGGCLFIGDGDDVPCARVVGVVEESRRYGLREEPAMQYYVPLGQEQGFGGRILLVRTTGDPHAVLAPLRAELQRLDGLGGYADIATLRERIDPQVRPWRLGTLLFGAFGALALGIAAIGTYSVVAYGVSRRTHEMGMRMVLGARTMDVRRMVLRQGAAIVALGIVLGLGIALVLGRMARALLFDVAPHDPVVLGGVVVILLSVALLASWIPAVRATRVDPVDALRAD